MQRMLTDLSWSQGSIATGCDGSSGCGLEHNPNDGQAAELVLGATAAE